MSPFKDFAIPPLLTPADECRAMGHAWSVVWSTANLHRGLTMVTCEHCHACGWLA